MVTRFSFFLFFCDNYQMIYHHPLIMLFTTLFGWLTLPDARVLDYVTRVVSIPELRPVVKKICHYVMADARIVASVSAQCQDAGQTMWCMTQASSRLSCISASCSSFLMGVLPISCMTFSVCPQARVRW